MLVRIVKMRFRESELSNFTSYFDTIKHHIRQFPGCHFLELYQDLNDPCIFFTYSYWEDETALESYRISDTFKEIWSTTKVLFDARPEAWSVQKRRSLL